MEIIWQQWSRGCKYNVWLSFGVGNSYVMFSDESCQLAEILSKLRKEWLPHIQNEKKLNVSCLVSSRKNEEILALNVVESNKHLLELILVRCILKFNICTILSVL